MSDQMQIFPSLKDHAVLATYAPEPWLLVIRLREVIARLIALQGQVIHPSAQVHPSAKVVDSFIGPGASIYEGVTVRESAVLDNTTVGHVSEVARSLLMESVMVPRFNYVGSSILGRLVQLGGAVMLASRRHDRRPPTVHWGTERVVLSVDQFGSLVGDGTTVAYGCHVNPGAVIGNDSLILPYVDVQGFIPPRTIARVKQSVQLLKRRDIPYLGTELESGSDVEGD